MGGEQAQPMMGVMHSHVVEREPGVRLHASTELPLKHQQHPAQKKRAARPGATRRWRCARLYQIFQVFSTR